MVFISQDGVMAAWKGVMVMEFKAHAEIMKQFLDYNAYRTIGLEETLQLIMQVRT